jgi:hypothetical protein
MFYCIRETNVVRSCKGKRKRENLFFKVRLNFLKCEK